MSLSFSASGSLTSMAMIFQSVSPASDGRSETAYPYSNVPLSTQFIPSSISAMAPRTLTCLMSPVLATALPISHTSSGSLSPKASVSGCLWEGSSQVWRKRQGRITGGYVQGNGWHFTHLREGTVVPHVPITIFDKAKLAVLRAHNDHTTSTLGPTLTESINREK